MKKRVRLIIMSMMIVGCMAMPTGCTPGAADGVGPTVSAGSVADNTATEYEKGSAEAGGAGADAPIAKQESSPTLDELVGESSVEVMIPEGPVEEMTPTENVEIGIGGNAGGSF